MIRKTGTLVASFLILTAAPLLAFAQLSGVAPSASQSSALTPPASGSGGPTFATVVSGKVVPLFDDGIIPLLYALAFLFFVIGIVRFFFSTSEEQREKGKEFVVWSLLGIAIIFTVWGFVQLLLSVLGSATTP